MLPFGLVESEDYGCAQTTFGPVIWGLERRNLIGLWEDVVDQSADVLLLRWRVSHECESAACTLQQEQSMAGALALSTLLLAGGITVLTKHYLNESGILTS